MKIDFRRDSYLSLEEIKSNMAYAHSLGLPDARQFRAMQRRLSVIGGGPSIDDHIADIAEPGGSRWAINGAYHWCKAHRINATFFSLDQTDYMRDLVKEVDRAILSSACDPEVFDALKGSDVAIADFGGEGLPSGSSSATAAPFLALLMGYQEVTFYGCESSYGETTHAYLDEPPEFGMIVTCGGASYHTSAQMFMQAQELSAMINASPTVFRERCGGLLRAMIENNGEYDITAVAPALQAKMKMTGPTISVSVKTTEPAINENIAA